MRRADRPRRQDHLAARDVALRNAVYDGIDAHRPSLRDANSRRLRFRDDIEIPPSARRVEVADRRAPAPPLAHGLLKIPDAFLLRPVDVVVARNAQLHRAGDEAVAELAVVRRVADSQRPARAVIAVRPAFLVLRPLEIGQHVVVGPTGIAELPPLVVVGTVAANVEQAVDRARPAQHLAARPLQRTAAEAGVRLGFETPVVFRVVHGFEIADRNMDPRVPVAAARLEQQHPRARVRRQAVRQHASRRARADYDVVIGV